MTRFQVCVLIASLLWLGIITFVLLGARWGREVDEAGQRLFDHHDKEGDQ